MLIPIFIGLGGLALYRGTRPSLHGVLTPERRALFMQALQKSDPPLTADQLVTLSQAFSKQGLAQLADILQKRAVLRSLPPEKKAYRSAVYKKLLSIKDPDQADVIARAADAFDEDSAYGQAATLRDYANGLRAQANMAKIAEVTAPPPAPAPESAADVDTSAPQVVTEAPFVDAPDPDNGKFLETDGEAPGVFTTDIHPSDDDKAFT
jgi:hypothetical protein